MDRSPTAITLRREDDARAWDGTYGATVVVFISTPYDHERFLEEHGLDYGLFSDSTNAVAEAYGVVHDLDGIHGVTGPRPAAFLFEADRTVRYAWVTDEWPAYLDYDAVEAAPREL